ncbi:MAG: porin [Halioglobus sp.]
MSTNYLHLLMATRGRARQVCGTPLVKRALFLIGLTAGGFILAHTALADTGWAYGKRGLEWSAPDTGSYLWTGVRAQSRYSSLANNFNLIEDFDQPTESGFTVNRARIKIGAGYQNLLTGYHEYDVRNGNLLDLRATWVQNPAFNVRVGQWKPEFNRERVDSSGKQQFSDRSVANYWFTIDRQWGAVASGRLAAGAKMDSSWWAGVLGGNGRSESSDGGKPMLMARWQWNYTGEVLPFSQSALKRYETPRGSLAFAAVTNESQYTRFSSSGGGQLEGYEPGSNNQYRIEQIMQEWSWQHRGTSVQQELHWKSITDQRNGGTRDIYGGYAQAGWFPSQRWQTIPDNLEVASRVAYVNQDAGDGLHDIEFSIATNLFFNGHRNKLTFEASYLSVVEDDEQESDIRFQVQWDLSL